MLDMLVAFAVDMTLAFICSFSQEVVCSLYSLYAWLPVYGRRWREQTSAAPGLFVIIIVVVVVHNNQV